MINTTNIQVSQEAIVSITCDKCGKISTPGDMIEYQEFYSLWKTGGYGSVFGDESDIQVDFCQQCLKELIGPYCRVDGEKL